ncbi:hypothetical protein IEO21_08229 [Rhodonia placenta]|uniref:Uncharacterized protein n=1 Tax=Rhodonia placenta TaxID=104341 RepID=A0A8H7NX34_9APHY|nr:hypothetical protein IEO21_08229 [Postia placenta]
MTPLKRKRGSQDDEENRDESNGSPFKRVHQSKVDILNGCWTSRPSTITMPRSSAPTVRDSGNWSPKETGWMCQMGYFETARLPRDTGLTRTTRRTWARMCTTMNTTSTNANMPTTAVKMMIRIRIQVRTIVIPSTAVNIHTDTGPRRRTVPRTHL